MSCGIPQSENSQFYSSLAIRVGLLVSQNQAIRDQILLKREQLSSQGSEDYSSSLEQDETFQEEISKLKELKSRLWEVDQSLQTQEEQLAANEQQNLLIEESIQSL